MNQSALSQNTSTTAFLRGSWWFTAGLSVLFIACYWRTISATAVLLTDSEDMAHGFFAPLVAVFTLWTKSRNGLTTRLKGPSLAAIPLLAVGALVAVPASLGASTTISRFGMLFSLSGCALLLGGFPLLREVRFPLALLFYTFPIPPVLYGEITLPLQVLGSRLAEGAFELLGYSVLREGNVIELSNQRLSVVEACSGLRSLVTLSFFTATYAYFMEDRNWVRGLLFLAAIPSAILINAMRITLTGVLGRTDPAWTKGTAHDITGWACFGIGFLLVLLVHWLANRMMRKEKTA